MLIKVIFIAPMIITKVHTPIFSQIQQVLQHLEKAFSQSQNLN